tara:strand:- start:242 stop:718 length:477 start_codon:yes stop_codon:yes gene_type:complete
MLSFKKLNTTFSVFRNNGVALKCFRAFDFYKVVGNSMDPFLREGEWILCSKNLDNINRGSVVIFNTEADTAPHIKRIIGLPNEKLEIIDGILQIDGRVHEYGASFKFPLTIADENKEWELANNQYFVIGDNILHSTDSRTYGLIKKTQILSKYIWKIW